MLDVTGIKERIDGLISEDEGETLADLAANSKADIVEIGAYKGLSTAYLAAGAKANIGRHMIWSIDLWDMTHAGDVRIKKKKRRPNFDSKKVFAEFQKNVKPFSDLHVYVQGNSAEIGKVWNSRIGVLFIDGAHDFESVRTDFALFSPYVVMGGYVAFHDATDPKSKVGKVIETIVKPSGEWEFIRQVNRLAVFRRIDYKGTFR